MNLIIQKFKQFCELNIQNFESKVLPLSYEEHGILLWEGFAFCSMAEMLGIQVLIESGIAKGRSTEIWSKYFSCPIYAIDDAKLYGGNLLLKTKERLKSYSHLKVYSGDSNMIIPELLENVISPNLKVGVFLDGPKGMNAIQLAQKCFKYENVILAGIHDQCLRHNPNIPYHQMDCWENTVFYTDEDWFFEQFRYLDYSQIDCSLELKQQLLKYPKGPGVGLAIKNKKFTNCVNHFPVVDGNKRLQKACNSSRKGIARSVRSCCSF